MPVTTALRSPTVQGFFATRPYSHSQKTADRTDTAMMSSARQPKYQMPNAPAGTSATITSSITPCTVRPAWMCDLSTMTLAVYPCFRPPTV